MSTLNRSSYWTLYNDDTIRVKHMTIAEIQCAIVDLEGMERDELYNDPYIVTMLCMDSNACNMLGEPIHKKDGFLLEDWHDLFSKEIEKRLKFLSGHSIRCTQKVKKTNFLVKWFKFW